MFKIICFLFFFFLVASSRLLVAGQPHGCQSYALSTPIESPFLLTLPNFWPQLRCGSWLFSDGSPCNSSYPSWSPECWTCSSSAVVCAAYGLCCSYSGVIGGSDLEVRTLELPWIGLTGDVPNLSGLPNLEYLSLAQNRLTGLFPQLSAMKSLAQLDLSFNFLSGSIPSWISSLPLSNLDLSNNSFSGSIPDIFLSFDHLSFLDLSGNQLTGIIPESICNVCPTPSGNCFIKLAGNHFQCPLPSCCENGKCGVDCSGGVTTTTTTVTSTRSTSMTTKSSQCSSQTWLQCPPGTGIFNSSTSYPNCCGTTTNYCPSSFSSCVPGGGCCPNGVTLHCNFAGKSYCCPPDFPVCGGGSDAGKCMAGTCSCDGCIGPNPCQYNIGCNKCAACCQSYIAKGLCQSWHCDTGSGILAANCSVATKPCPT